MSDKFQKMESEFNEIQTYSVDVDGKIDNQGEPLVLRSSSAPDEAALEDKGDFTLNPLEWVKGIQKDVSEFSWEMTERKRVLMRAVFGEGLVTFLFLFIVEATAVNNTRQESPENLVLGCISTAFCAVALIYSFADVSGAHFNPAVTFATVVTGKVSVRKGLAYIGIQMVAAVIATAWLMVVFPKAHDEQFKSIPLSVVVDIDKTAGVAHAFFMEMSLTFVLVYVVFATAFDTVDTTGAVKVAADGTKSGGDAGKNLTIYTTSGNTKAGFAPVAIGFTLGFLGLLGGSVSGGAFNPARVFGPAAITGSWNNHWLYWVADFLGAALAGMAQSCFAHEATQTSHVKSNKHMK